MDLVGQPLDLRVLARGGQELEPGEHLRIRVEDLFCPVLQPGVELFHPVDHRLAADDGVGLGGVRRRDVGNDEEDDVNELSVVGGAAAARNEAGAVMAKSLGQHGESGATSVDPMGPQ